MVSNCYSNCSYDILESWVPLSTDEEKYIKESLLRLENISACAVVRNGRKCQTLSNTPAPLHKILWKAYLRDEFYAHRDEEAELCLDGLPELLCHWPNTEFNLKEVMPKLHTGFWFKEPSTDENDYGLGAFYSKVVLAIVKTFNISYDYISVEEHVLNCNIVKIDISGFHRFDWNEFQLLLNNFVNLEVILDVETNEDEFGAFVVEQIDQKGRLTYHNKSSNFNVVIKFRHVMICGPSIGEGYERDYLTRTQLVGNVLNNGAISLFIDGYETTENMFKNNENRVNIVDLGPVILEDSSLNIVQYFPNLTHLDVSGNNLHGRLGGLRHMHKGLLYLDLSKCCLENADLEHLIGSCHQSTLRQLNLSGNIFSYDSIYSSVNLIRLCHNLTKVLQLDLSNCLFQSWPTEDIESLFHSLKIMPNIISLDLQGNKFSILNVTVHIMVLNESPSLRYLNISLPKQVTDDNLNNQNDLVKEFCSKIKEDMNKTCTQLLYVDFEN